MPQYRVRPGFRHGIGKRYGPGDVLTLTEKEAVGFLDKLERVDEVLPVPVSSGSKIEEDASEVPSIAIPANAIDFAAIKGISDRMQDVLYEAGYFTWEDVLNAGVIALRDAGIDMIHARMLFNIAQKESD